MFTGIVTDMGTVESVLPRQGGVRLVLRPGSLLTTSEVDVFSGDGSHAARLNMTLAVVETARVRRKGRPGRKQVQGEGLELGNAARRSRGG